MPSRLMLSRAAAIALRALVELAREPGTTLSVAELARRQDLPQPMLEQIVLRLRRAGVVEARRGRHGGYRLAQRAESLPLARVLRAVEGPQDIRAGGEPGSLQEAPTAWPAPAPPTAGGEWTLGLDGPRERPPAAAAPPSQAMASGRQHQGSPAAPRGVGPGSAAPGSSESQAHGSPAHPVNTNGAPAPAESASTLTSPTPWSETTPHAPDATVPASVAGHSLGASAGHRVEQQLRLRLERLVERELERLTLAELLYDQRSWEASLGPAGGGLMLL